MSPVFRFEIQELKELKSRKVETAESRLELFNPSTPFNSSTVFHVRNRIPKGFSTATISSLASVISSLVSVWLGL